MEINLKQIHLHRFLTFLWPSLWTQGLLRQTDAEHPDYYLLVVCIQQFRSFTAQYHHLLQHNQELLLLNRKEVKRSGATPNAFAPQESMRSPNSTALHLQVYHEAAVKDGGERDSNQQHRLPVPRQRCDAVSVDTPFNSTLSSGCCFLKPDVFLTENTPTWSGAGSSVCWSRSSPTVSRAGTATRIRKTVTTRTGQPSCRSSALIRTPGTRNRQVNKGWRHWQEGCWFKFPKHLCWKYSKV